MENKLFIVTDLGPGDGGKGAVVHKLCTEMKAHTVVKVGGAQGNHGVHTSRGEHSGFRHFGCGTFEGVRTHISERMVIEPYRMLSEAEVLQNEWRIHDIFDLLTVDQNALCVTPFHTLSSRMRELLHGDNPRGTVGVGVGDAVRDLEEFPETAIFVKDLASSGLKEKLEAIRARKLKLYEYELSSEFRYFFEGESRIHVEDIIKSFNDEGLIDRAVGVFKELYSKLKIVDGDYFKNQILDKDGVIVVEGSHGVLNDRLFGFHPHTTALRILPSFTLDMLSKYEYQGEIKKLGVTRAYSIRHGAGPMVTHSPAMLSMLLPGSTKDENRWQGRPMVGPLDFITLDYAIQVCGGPQFFDGLCVTWGDQIEKMGFWPICEEYSFGNWFLEKKFFTKEGKMKVYYGKSVDDQIAYQSELTHFLKDSCRAVKKQFDLSGKGRGDFQNLLVNTFEQNLSIPVKMISFGPTEKDKVLL